jgi:hypothetical protein
VARSTPVPRTALPSGPITLVIDSTGLKVYGAAERRPQRRRVADGRPEGVLYGLVVVGP